MKKKEPYKPIIHFFLISRKETLTEGDQNDTSAKTAYFQSHGKREREEDRWTERKRERERRREP